MKITRDNYEQFMIDFLDNNMSTELKTEMTRFLEANPDIREEAEGLFSVEAEDFQIRYPQKDALKAIAKVEDEYEISRVDYLSVADLESDITEDEKKELTKLEAKDTSVTQLKNSLQKTKLEPDTTILYPAKDLLKSIAAEEIIEDRTEYLAIAAAEGDLNETEKVEWFACLKEKPELAELEDEFRQIKLEADPNLVFEDKSSLKQNPFAVNRFTYMPVAVAASIVAVFFVLGSIFTPQDTLSVNGMADIHFSDELRKESLEHIQTEDPVNTYVQEDTYYAHENTGNNNTNSQNTIVDNGSDSDYEYEPINLPRTDVKVEPQEIVVYAMNEPEDIFKKQELPANYYDFETPATEPQIKPAWMLAEKGVDVWRTMTSSDLMMANSYTEDGDIKKFSIRGKRIGISRTFHRK